MTGLFLSISRPSAHAIGQASIQLLAVLTCTVILPRAAAPLFSGATRLLSRARWPLVGRSRLGLWFVLLGSAFPFHPASFHSFFSFLFFLSFPPFSFSYRACPVVSHPKEAHSFDSPPVHSRSVSNFFPLSRVYTTPRSSPFR